MKFYEIDQQIRDLLDQAEIDEETGELIGFDQKAFDELLIERNSKIEGLGIYIKELTAESEALKIESKKLKDRIDQKNKKIDNLKRFLTHYLSSINMYRFETPTISIGFRKSEVVDADEDLVPKKYFTKKIEYSLDKMGIKKLLKSGTKIKGARLIEKQNIQIK